MFKSVVYKGDCIVGEVEIYPKNQKTDMLNKEIRISHLSQPSERCPPLAVLHTISSSAPYGGVCFKMEPKLQSEDSPFFYLHSTCLRENKTAVVPLGEEELHLVAMTSRNNLEQHLCFWGFIVAQGLYNSCLVMLNLRCLGIVFDLDETLIVANTMRSFEDRIDALQRKVNTEMDPQRLSGMLAEMKRYQDDKIILKQYLEHDQVVENGKVIKVQPEMVPALSDDHPSMVRPIIRLREKNIILTRINPQIRDTSVLVRLRPAWEDLRSYLTARGRKRFEVYVCTMAERDYALEMWRLLDPESNLIASKELLDRIVCVKAGSRKSLLNVFHDGICHPKMALVIDDRLKVWDEKDQPRVHVVPAFAPYYAPQAEANNVIPVLCVARNVACNVRGGFFKDFDEGLLQKIFEVSYEDDLVDFPTAPDVSNYLISEDDASAPSKDPLSFEGMALADAEVERRLKDAIPASSVVTNLDPRQASLQHLVASLSNTIAQAIPHGPMIPMPNKQFPQAVPSGKPLGDLCPEPSLQGSPAREEGEVPESELDPDTRRRLLILQHGQDTRDHTSSEPPFPARPPIQPPVPLTQPCGSWFPLEGEINPKNVNRALPKPVPKEFPLEPEPLHYDKPRGRQPSFFRGSGSSISSDRTLHENKRFPKEVHRGDNRSRRNRPLSKSRSFSGERMPWGRSASTGKDLPAGVLEEIAMKCGTKVEFRTALVSIKELQFSIQVWFSGEIVGEGIGRTRKEAQCQAAEHALRNLANKYLSNALSDSTSANGDFNKAVIAKENGFPSDSNSLGPQTIPKEDPVPLSSSTESSRSLDSRLDGAHKVQGPVSALKELCMKEELSLIFQDQSPLPTNLIHEGGVHAQVVIGGEVLGKGSGLTWDEAKMKAAEEALHNLNSTLEQGSQNADSSRSFDTISSKRLKTEAPRVMQRIPSSSRHTNNVPPVP